MQRHIARFAVVRYGVAALCVTATVIVALWLRPVVLAAAQLLLAAVLITGWVSGLRPALVAWVLATSAIWEEDFSRVKIAIDDLKARGVRDFRAYFAAHREFVRHAAEMVRIVDVNDASVKMFAAGSKDELLASLNKLSVPETREAFVEVLVGIADGRTSFEAETVAQNLKGETLTVLFTLTRPPSASGRSISPRRCSRAPLTASPS